MTESDKNFSSSVDVFYYYLVYRSIEVIFMFILRGHGIKYCIENLFLYICQKICAIPGNIFIYFWS